MPGYAGGSGGSRRCPAQPSSSARTRAVELVAAGMSYDQVAAELGYANRSGAWKAVQASLKAVQADTVDEYRTLTLERLEACWRSCGTRR
jgi:uncharacterized protein (DUF433 family)